MTAAQGSPQHRAVSPLGLREAGHKETGAYWGLKLERGIRGQRGGSLAWGGEVSEVTNNPKRDYTFTMVKQT